MASTSGWLASSQTRTWGRRTRRELTFQVAIFMAFPSKFEAVVAAAQLAASAGVPEPGAQQREEDCHAEAGRNLSGKRGCPRAGVIGGLRCGQQLRGIEGSLALGLDGREAGFECLGVGQRAGK